MSFLFVLIASVASLLWIRSHYGVRAMVAFAWAYSFILPTMLRISIGGASLEIRQMVMLFVIGYLFCQGERWLPERWLWIDTLVLCLTVSQLVTEVLTDHVGPAAVVSFTMDWMLPYLFGRLAFQSLDDMRLLIRAAALVIVVLFVAATAEAITRVNPMQLISFGPAALQIPCDMRWGLRRADGPSQHPISFGMMLVFLLPWALAAASEARAGRGPRWWKYLPWMGGAAVFFSMSRGPQVAIAISLLGMVYFRFPAWRSQVLTGLGIGALCLAMGRGYLVDALHVWSNESKQDAAAEQLVINGVAMEYSGTNHRFLQLLVYQEAALEAGLFGYGTVAMSTTPSTIPHVDPNLELTFHSIDNHYLCFLLGKGYLGIGLFILLGCAVLSALWRPADMLDSPHSQLAAALFSIIVAEMIVLTTVWFCFAFGCNWLIAAGLAVSLRQHFDRCGVENDAAPAARPAPEMLRQSPVEKFVRTRRLVPGHPQMGQIGVESPGGLSQA